MARGKDRNAKKEAAASTPSSSGETRNHTSGSGAPSEGLPPWVPPTLFGVLAVFLFREFVFSDRMLVGGDTLSLGYVARALYADALATLGRIPRWSPHLLGGTPFLEALSGGDSLYPPSLLLLLVLEPYRALGWKLVLHVFLAGLFFFGWVRAIGGSRQAALFGGAAYMLAPFLVGFVHPGHDGKIFVTALAPLLFWATERHFARATLASVAGIGLVVALVLYTTHFQMAYFLFGGAGVYAIYRTVRIVRADDEVFGTENAGRTRAAPAGGAEAAPATGATARAGFLRFGLFLAGSVLGAAGAAYQFVPAAEYVTESSRRIQTTRDAAGESGRAWSSSWSMHPEEAMSLIIPEFAGNAAGGAAWSTNTYWGRNGFKDNHEYAGLVVLLLAAISFAGARRRQLRYFLVVLGLLALAFALGTHTPVWGLFYAVVPGIRLFRAPGMVVYLFGFGAITLAALGVDRLRALVRDEDGWARIRNVLWGATGAMGLLALLVTSGVFTSLWTSIVYPGIDERRMQILAAHLPNVVRGASLAFVLTAAVAGVVWAAAARRIPWNAAFALLVGLAVVDAVRIDASFIQTLDFHQWSQADPNVRTLLEREQGSDEPYRLLSFVRAGQDVLPAMHGIELAAGHHPNDLSRYRELIGMVGSGMPRNLLPCDSLDRCTRVGVGLNPNVRRILNVRYLLWPDAEIGPWPGGGAVSRTQYGGGQPYQTLVAEDGLPRARLVGASVVKSDAEAVAYILGADHDPEREVVLAEVSPIALDGTPPNGSVTWVERGPDRLELRVESDRPALLVVADNWFPAWRARVDGTETDVLRAYHTLRAVPVPEGTTTVEMWYESTLLRRSFLVSIVTVLGLLAAWGYGTWRGRTREGS